MKNIVKNSVSCYIYDKFNERGMKSFEKKIARFLRENGIGGNIICHNAYMERANGRGSYNRCAEIEVQGSIYTLRSHTNDSEAWDNWNYPTTKDKRNLFLFVLEDEITSLQEDLAENL